MLRFVRLALVSIGAFAVTLPLLAQESRGTLSGSVADPTGAQIPGAKVTVTETHTGTKIETQSNGSGQYTAPYLLPGDYDISVAKEGFKSALRKGIHVGADDRQVIDFTLDVGSATQTVEVTAESPLLNNENASVGQAITTKEVEDLPLNGRTPLVLAALSMGVLATGQPSLIHPFDSAGAAGWSIGGTPSQTNEILIDGSPDATWDGRLAYSPPTDAVEEVRVKAFDSDASFGHTFGGTMNQVLKSGTNTLHGSVWEFNQPNTLVANNFFNNKAGLGNPVTHYNQYGVTAGGPIWIPKVFNGRNRVFWFFAWEGLKDNQPNTTFLSVPTQAERNGDFSALAAQGITIYNPFSATQSGSTITRQPFQTNNVIPSNYISQIAQAYLKLIPLPNLTGTATGFNNFGSTASSGLDNYNNELGRLDFNATNRDRMFFDIRSTDYSQSKNNYFSDAATGSLLTRNNWGGSIDNVFTVNPTNVLDLRLNFTRMNEAHPAPSAGFDPASLGFPSYLATSSELVQLPNLAFASANGVPAIGSNGANALPSQSLQLYGTWLMVKGNHTLKFGGDARQYVFNPTSFGNSTGTFSFSSNSWVKASSSASSTVVAGQDLAELMMGLPTSGSYDVNASGSFFEHYGAIFAQDDWRVRSNLTINLGIRFEHDAPYHEKFDRTSNGFDPAGVNPLQAAAQAAYAKNPISLLPVSAFNVLGGLTYPTDGALYTQLSHPVSPRIGVAWTPKALHNKTVVRAGFGRFVEPVGITQLDITGKYSTNPVLQQYGFSQTTSMVVTSNNFLSPAATLADPFPSGIKQPVGNALGLGTFAGQTIQFIAPNQEDPYSIRWNFGIQQELGKNSMLEVMYMGNHGVHLPVFVTQLNGIPRQYLSTLPVRDTTVINALTATTPNPFSGLATAQNTASTSVEQLLAKYPQFPVGEGSFSSGVIELNNPIGNSYYESLNVRYQKRYSQGLSLVGNYIFSKLIERDTWLNVSDTSLEKRVSRFDHPNRFVLGLVYEVPVGRGKLVNVEQRWMNYIAGGWEISSIYTYQTGAPVIWNNGSTTSPGDYVYFGAPIVFNNREANTASFNTSAFDTKSADALQFHIRTFPTVIPSLREDGINEWSPSLIKRTSITEHIALQLRLEAYNVLNHPVFGPPNTTATNSGFGSITTQANRPRTLQIGARLVF